MIFLALILFLPVAVMLDQAASLNLGVRFSMQLILLNLETRYASEGGIM